MKTITPEMKQVIDTKGIDTLSDLEFLKFTISQGDGATILSIPMRQRAVYILDKCLSEYKELVSLADRSCSGCIHEGTSHNGIPCCDCARVPLDYYTEHD